MAPSLPRSDHVLRWVYLGEVDYEEALALQERLRAQIIEGARDDTLLLLTHPPVITLGRSGRSSNILVSHEVRRARGVKLVRVGRGGDVTYHGPGQLVGYPVRRIGRSVAAHVEGMAQGVVATLARLGIRAAWDPGRPGVWTTRGKIAAIGVDARGGVATHGLALNVTTDLAAFEMIVPCGLRARVTSVREALGDAQVPRLEDLALDLAVELAARYGKAAEEVTEETL